MLIRLAAGDPRPLYEQIASSIRRQIADGQLAPGTRLPAGRDLAAVLDVTLETVQRAYRVCVDEGLLTSRVGRGTSVSDDLDPTTLALDAELDRLVQRAHRTGIGLDEVVQRLREAW